MQEENSFSVLASPKEIHQGSSKCAVLKESTKKSIALMHRLISTTITEPEKIASNTSNHINEDCDLERSLALITHDFSSYSPTPQPSTFFTSDDQLVSILEGRSSPTFSDHDISNSNQSNETETCDDLVYQSGNSKTISFKQTVQKNSDSNSENNKLNIALGEISDDYNNSLFESNIELPLVKLDSKREQPLLSSEDNSPTDLEKDSYNVKISDKSETSECELSQPHFSEANFSINLSSNKENSIKKDLIYTNNFNKNEKPIGNDCKEISNENPILLDKPYSEDIKKLELDQDNSLAKSTEISLDKEIYLVSKEESQASCEKKNVIYSLNIEKQPVNKNSTIEKTNNISQNSILDQSEENSPHIAKKENDETLLIKSHEAGNENEEQQTEGENSHDIFHNISIEKTNRISQNSILVQSGENSPHIPKRENDEILIKKELSLSLIKSQKPESENEDQQPAGGSSNNIFQNVTIEKTNRISQNSILDQSEENSPQGDNDEKLHRKELSLSLIKSFEAKGDNDEKKSENSSNQMNLKTNQNDSKTSEDDKKLISENKFLRNENQCKDSSKKVIKKCNEEDLVETSLKRTLNEDQLKEFEQNDESINSIQPENKKFDDRTLSTLEKDEERKESLTEKGIQSKEKVTTSIVKDSLSLGKPFNEFEKNEECKPSNSKSTKPKIYEEGLVEIANSPSNEIQLKGNKIDDSKKNISENFKTFSKESIQIYDIIKMNKHWSYYLEQKKKSLDSSKCSNSEKTPPIETFEKLSYKATNNDFLSGTTQKILDKVKIHDESLETSVTQNLISSSNLTTKTPISNELSSHNEDKKLNNFTLLKLDEEEKSSKQQIPRNLDIKNLNFEGPQVMSIESKETKIVKELVVDHSINDPIINDSSKQSVHEFQTTSQISQCSANNSVKLLSKPSNISSNTDLNTEKIVQSAPNMCKEIKERVNENSSINIPQREKEKEISAKNSENFNSFKSNLNSCEIKNIGNPLLKSLNLNEKPKLQSKSNNPKDSNELKVDLSTEISSSNLLTNQMKLSSTTCEISHEDDEKCLENNQGLKSVPVLKSNVLNNDQINGDIDSQKDNLFTKKDISNLRVKKPSQFESKKAKLESVVSFLGRTKNHCHSIIISNNLKEASLTSTILKSDEITCKTDSLNMSDSVESEEDLDSTSHQITNHDVSQNQDYSGHICNNSVFVQKVKTMNKSTDRKINEIKQQPNLSLNAEKNIFTSSSKKQNSNKSNTSFSHLTSNSIEIICKEKHLSNLELNLKKDEKVKVKDNCLINTNFENKNSRDNISDDVNKSILNPFQLGKQNITIEEEKHKIISENSNISISKESEIPLNDSDLKQSQDKSTHFNSRLGQDLNNEGAPHSLQYKKLISSQDVSPNNFTFDDSLIKQASISLLNESFNEILEENNSNINLEEIENLKCMATYLENEDNISKVFIKNINVLYSESISNDFYKDNELPNQNSDYNLENNLTINNDLQFSMNLINPGETGNLSEKTIQNINNDSEIIQNENTEIISIKSQVQDSREMENLTKETVENIENYSEINQNSEIITIDSQVRNSNDSREIENLANETIQNINSEINIENSTIETIENIENVSEINQNSEIIVNNLQVQDQNQTEIVIKTENLNTLEDQTIESEKIPSILSESSVGKNTVSGENVFLNHPNKMLKNLLPSEIQENEIKKENQDEENLMNTCPESLVSSKTRVKSAKSKRSPSSRRSEINKYLFRIEAWHKLENHTGARLFCCDICPATYKRHHALKRHFNTTHIIQGQLGCHLCSETILISNISTAREQLEIHFQLKHPERERPRPHALCLYCERGFTSQPLARRHLVIHRRQASPHLCIYCPETFSSLDTILAHLLRAHEESYFACLECERRFSSQRGLDAHLMSRHVKQARFSCQRCDRSFSSEVNRSRHVLIAHQESSAEIYEDHSINTPIIKSFREKESSSTSIKESTMDKTPSTLQKESRRSGSLLSPNAFRVARPFDMAQVDLSTQIQLKAREINYPTENEETDQTLISQESFKESDEETKTIESSSKTEQNSHLFSLDLNLKRTNLENTSNQCSSSLVNLESNSFSLSGEWVIPRIYVCAACHKTWNNFWDILEHKWEAHPNINCTHYEIVDGAQPSAELLYNRHIYAVEAASHTSNSNKKITRKCTKCGLIPTASSSNASFHAHLLECAGDLAWSRTATNPAISSNPSNRRNTRKWRPFGSRRRRGGGNNSSINTRNSTLSSTSSNYSSIFNTNTTSSNRRNTSSSSRRRTPGTEINRPDMRALRAARRAILFEEVKPTTSSEAMESTNTSKPNTRQCRWSPEDDIPLVKIKESKQTPSKKRTSRKSVQTNKSNSPNQKRKQQQDVSEPNKKKKRSTKSKPLDSTSENAKIEQTPIKEENNLKITDASSYPPLPAEITIKEEPLDEEEISHPLINIPKKRNKRKRKSAPSPTNNPIDDPEKNRILDAMRIAMMDNDEDMPIAHLLKKSRPVKLKRPKLSNSAHSSLPHSLTNEEAFKEPLTSTRKTDSLPESFPLDIFDQDEKILSQEETASCNESNYLLKTKRHKSSKFICQECQKVFRSAFGLHRHIKKCKEIVTKEKDEQLTLLQPFDNIATLNIDQEMQEPISPNAETSITSEPANSRKTPQSLQKEFLKSAIVHAQTCEILKTEDEVVDVTDLEEDSNLILCQAEVKSSSPLLLNKAKVISTPMTKDPAETAYVSNQTSQNTQIQIEEKVNSEIKKDELKEENLNENEKKPSKRGRKRKSNNELLLQSNQNFEQTSRSLRRNRWNISYEEMLSSSDIESDSEETPKKLIITSPDFSQSQTSSTSSPIDKSEDSSLSIPTSSKGSIRKNKKKLHCKECDKFYSSAANLKKHHLSPAHKKKITALEKSCCISEKNKDSLENSISPQEKLNEVTNISEEKNNRTEDPEIEILLNKELPENDKCLPSAEVSSSEIKSESKSDAEWNENTYESLPISSSQITQDNSSSQITLDNSLSQITQDNSSTQITKDNLTSQITQDDLSSQITQGDLSQITQDNLSSQLTQDNLTSQLTPDNLSSQLTPDNLTSQLTQDNLPSQLTQDNLTSQITQDDLSSQITQDDLSQITHDNSSSQITQDNLSSQLTQDNLSSQLIQDNLSSQLTQDNLPSQLTQDNISSQIAQNNPSIENEKLTISEDWNSRTGLGIILGHVNQILDSSEEPSSSVVYPSDEYSASQIAHESDPPPSERGSLPWLQEAMGATDEEMALLERLGEPVEITDLDKPKTPPPSSPPPPPPQEQTSETALEIRSTPTTFFTASFSPKSLLRRCNALLQCYVCDRRFMGLAAFRAHLDSEHQINMADSHDDSTLLQACLISMPNTDDELNNEISGQLFCASCREVFSTDIQLTEHSIREHRTNRTRPMLLFPPNPKIQKRNSSSTDQPVAGPVEAEGLRSHISSALGGLLDKALKNLLNKNNCKIDSSESSLLLQLASKKLKNTSNSNNYTTSSTSTKSNKSRTFNTPLAIELRNQISLKTQKAVSKSNTVDLENFSCPHCFARFQKASALKRHTIQTHPHEKKSTDSTSVSKNSSNPASPCLQQGDDDGWRNMSPESEWSIDELSQEVISKETSEEGTFYCSSCGLGFSSPTQVVQHQQQNHSKTPDQIQQSSSSTPSTVSNNPTTSRSRSYQNSFNLKLVDQDEVREKAKAALKELSLLKKQHQAPASKWLEHKYKAARVNKSHDDGKSRFAFLTEKPLRQRKYLGNNLDTSNSSNPPLIIKKDADPQVYEFPDEETLSSTSQKSTTAS